MYSLQFNFEFSHEQITWNIPKTLFPLNQLVLKSIHTVQVADWFFTPKSSENKSIIDEITRWL